MPTLPDGLVDWIADLRGEADVVVDQPLAGASTATVWPARVGDDEIVVKVYDRGIDGVGPDDVRRDASAMRAVITQLRGEFTADL